MYFVDNNSAVPVMPQVKPVISTTPQYFTEGGNGVSPTYPGQDWFNIVQTEILNVLKEAGINPDKVNHAQLLAAMKKLFAANTDSLGALAALTGAANALPYFTGPKGAALTGLTQVGRDIIGKTSTDAVLQYLQLGGAAKLNVGTTKNTVAAGDATMGGSYLNVTSSRVMGVIYTNSAVRPMLVIFSYHGNSWGTVEARVNGTVVARTVSVNDATIHNGPSLSFIVPPGATYSATKTDGAIGSIIWAEMV